MKLRPILHVHSLLLIFLSIGMATAASIGFVLGDRDSQSFGFCAFATFAVGYSLCKLTERRRGELDFSTTTRGGYLAVAGGWCLAIIAAGLPFYFCSKLTIADSIFEAASGLTTTGGSIISPDLLRRDGMTLAEFGDLYARYAPEDLPLSKGILLWRSLLNWLGGVGIVFFMLMVLPFMKMGGGSMLYNAEVPGLKSDSDQLVPRLGESVLLVTIVYSALTLVAGCVFCFFGMTPFDAVCHAMAVLATGGFSTKLASVGYYTNGAIQWSVTAFMFIAACNFSLIIRTVMTRRFCFWKDEEFRFFFYMCCGVTLVITAIVYVRCPDSLRVTGGNGVLPRTFWGYLRTVAFQVATLASTTGFITSDFEAWNSKVAVVLLIAIMFPCGCGGSTAGGIKCSRLIVVFKHLASEIHRCISPHAVADVRLNNERVSQELITKSLAFVILYVLILMMGTFLLIICEYQPLQPLMKTAQQNVQTERIDERDGAADAQADSAIDFKTAFSSALSCISNVGPALGKVGAGGDFHWLRPQSKLLLALIMVIGRLELYTILVLFVPAFWKK